MSKKKEGFLMFCLMLILLATAEYNNKVEKENQSALKTQAESVNAKKRVNGKLPITRPLSSLLILSHNE